MRFGIILLILIALCSAAGSLIQQGQDISWYAQTYEGFHGFILMLGLNNIFKSWYFIALLVLLCMNLTLCSIIRIKGVVKSSINSVTDASDLPNTVSLTPEGIDKLRTHMSAEHCKEQKYGDTVVYSKHSIGRYGTFITHVAILLTVIFGAAALYLPVTTDKSCYPGEAVTMDDGTIITVNSFRIEDADGKLDFTSNIRISAPDGHQSKEADISVNHPFSFGSYKVYQQTYGTAGSITVSDPETGATDDFILDEVCFLSIDSVNGLWYEALYPGYIREESGDVTLITSTSGSYPDPVYDVQLASDGVYTPILAFPGDTVKVGGLEFTFNDPIEYPGLRIKYTPTIVNVLLCISFVLMIAGLYITFFMPPTLVKVDKFGYVVSGPKPENMRIKLKLLLDNYSKEIET